MFLISSLILIAIILILICVACIAHHKSDCAKESDPAEAPGPKAYPVIGNLHVLGGYEVPYQAFSALAERYGPIVKLQLGNVRAMVVNGQDNIKEVLITKGHHFDGRPNFERYNMLFSGDKDNSLAFCDFSEVQKMRREMLRMHTFPRTYTPKFNNLDTIITREVSKMMSRITPKTITEIKPFILECCANVFTTHFCSKSFTQADTDFLTMIRDFDEIFYEVNQGYAADFLPFLLPLHYGRLSKLRKMAHKIRHFIEHRVIEDRFTKWTTSTEASDYVGSLIEHVQLESSPQMDWNTALFALEDIIGGHSAVGNFLTKVLGYLVTRPEVQERIQMEVDDCTRELDGSNRQVTISDRNFLPYTEAVILEAIRLISSPIVPRVANQESTIAGYRVQKDTLLFLNNYDLSMSPKLWTEPEQFQPERFLKDGRIVKPEHFLPFGGGKRSCMGMKMVQLLTIGSVAGLMQNFNILPVRNETYNVPVGSLALPVKTFKFVFENR